MEPAISAKTFVTSLSDIKFAFKPVSAILPLPFSPCFIPLFLLSLPYLYTDFRILGPGSVSSVIGGILPVSSVLHFPLYMAAKEEAKPKTVLQLSHLLCHSTNQELTKIADSRFSFLSSSG